MSKIYNIILLHSHLPYINHPYSDYIEENWYFENVVESYIPLLMMIERLTLDGINPALTISLSPTLCNMMENELIEKKLKRYIELRLGLIETEMEKFSDNEKIQKILEIYEKKYIDAMNFINKYSADLITPFKLYQSQGLCEIITTPSTYPILPLVVNKELLDAHISIAKSDYKDRFSKNLNGIFLSECAYDERIEVSLTKNSIKYSFLNDTAIDTSKYSIYQSYKTENNLDFFIRDYSVNKKILGENGYVSNPVYREFYRDIGYERDIDYLKKWTLTEQRIPTGLKYHRITDVKTNIIEKDYYDYEDAIKQVDIDSTDFLNDRMKFLGDKDILMVYCLNMEIFGHRWFEGIDFLQSIYRKSRALRYPFNFVTPSSYLSLVNSKTEVHPDISSWDCGGFFDKWLNDKNDFIYPYIYEIVIKFIKIINKYGNVKIPFEIDMALKQLSREILLIQSSDWPVMISSNTHREYAIFRINTHYNNALKLMDMINSNSIDKEYLKKLERENAIFPFIDWRVFVTKSNY